MAEPIKKTETEKKTDTGSDKVDFISSEAEPYGFKVMGIDALRYPKDPSKLLWKVKKEDVDRFKRHHFVKRGRVVQA